MSRLYGLIGFPLGHSFSGKYFTEKFKREQITDASYKLFELNYIDDLPHLLEAESDLNGFNVTIPYKEKVIPYLDEIESNARKIGAVNVVKVNHGQLIGYNTDYIGFQASLLEFLKGATVKKALILGTGGASKAIAYALSDMDIKFLHVSRKGDFSYLNYAELDNKELMDAHQLIINTTPVGTSPAIDEYPDIPYHLLSKNHFLFDLVYNPAETLFMKKGSKAGAKVMNGHQMLVKQAEAAWEIWNKNPYQQV
ncbi:MAG: shikimate dehydrogenase [Cyclobacteriaceae bacterium]